MQETPIIIFLTSTYDFGNIVNASNSRCARSTNVQINLFYVSCTNYRVCQTGFWHFLATTTLMPIILVLHMRFVKQHIAGIAILLIIVHRATVWAQPEIFELDVRARGGSRDRSWGGGGNKEHFILQRHSEFFTTSGAAGVIAAQYCYLKNQQANINLIANLKIHLKQHMTQNDNRHDCALAESFPRGWQNHQQFLLIYLTSNIT